MCGTQLCNVRMWGSVKRNVWLALLTVAKLSPQQRSDMPQISEVAGPHYGVNTKFAVFRVVTVGGGQKCTDISEELAAVCSTMEAASSS